MFWLSANGIKPEIANIKGKGY